LSNKIIASIVALALLVGVGVLVSSGDTSSTTRNAALVVATPCPKPGQVTKVSKQSVVCATTNTGSLWYATMKAKGKAQACKSPGAIRKKSDIVWVCGVVKKKKLWQATRPLPPAVVASTTVIEPGATQPTPALDSTQVATPEAPVIADNTVLADPQIPEDKIVTQVIDNVITPPVITPQVITPPVITLACAAGGTCAIGETGPGGGKVFYVARSNFTSTGSDCGSNCRYLEAAPSDHTSTVAWCSNTSSSLDVLATGIGSGMSNTTKARTKCDSGAIQVAADYTNNSKIDWHLPSKDELAQLHTQRTTVGGFVAGIYWSSSEFIAGLAFPQGFDFGYQGYNVNKSTTYYVRPVRAF